MSKLLSICKDKIFITLEGAVMDGDKVTGFSEGAVTTLASVASKLAITERDSSLAVKRFLVKSFLDTNEEAVKEAYKSKADFLAEHGFIPSKEKDHTALFYTSAKQGAGIYKRICEERTLAVIDDNITAAKESGDMSKVGELVCEKENLTTNKNIADKAEKATKAHDNMVSALTKVGKRENLNSLIKGGKLSAADGKVMRETVSNIAAFLNDLTTRHMSIKETDTKKK